MLQAGPVGYGFSKFLTEEDAEYACKIMNQIKLWGKPIRINKVLLDKKQPDMGANLFVRNLDETVDERLLYDTFSAFGILVTTAKVARDPSTRTSKGYGFVSYLDFKSADAVIEAMNGQFLMNKAITIQYAFKKDGKGERHGTPAERLLAAQARKNNALPATARPPPATLNALAAFGPGVLGVGAQPAVPGHSVSAAPPYGASGPYQGQFAGALAAASAPSHSPIPPPPPSGFSSGPQTMNQMGMPGAPGAPPPGFLGYNMAIPPAMPPGLGPPLPQAMGMPPPPPGFGAAAHGVSVHQMPQQGR